MAYRADQPVLGHRPGRSSPTSDIANTETLEGGHLLVKLHEIIADGDRVVALVSGGGRTEFGVYENTYAFVHTVRDGLITTVDEYLDTAQVETKIFGKSILAR